MFLLASISPARAEEYVSRAWHSDEGLPYNIVRSIAQTKEGYLWVGTFAGLARFDGIRFTTFDARNTPVLKNSNVSALCTDADGALWIGTYGGALTRMKDGVFTHFGEQEGLVGDEITALFAAKDGSIWIGTTAGVNCYKDGKFSHYGTRDGLASDIVRSVLVDRSGTTWVGTGLGLNRIRNGQMDTFALEEGLPNNSIRGLAEDKDGGLWIGTDVGMTHYDGKTFRNYGPEDGLNERFVQNFAFDQRGNMWIGTYGGVVRLKDGKFHDEMSNDHEPYDLVNAIFVDHEGDVWAGSREGLIRFIPKRFTTFTKREGLSHNNVLCVEEDRDGAIWAGTWGAGLNKLAGGKVVKVYSTKQNYPQDLILSICQSHDGSMWVGADFDMGLVHIERDKIRQYTWHDGLFNAAVRALREGRDGRLWIGTSKGLVSFRDGKFFKYTVAKDNLAGPVVRDVHEDHQGRLWIATEDGLSLLQNDHCTNFTGSNGLVSTFLVSINESSNGDLWMGSYGGGIERMHDGRFTCYNTDHGLPSDDVFYAVEDNFGYMWISSTKGISRLRESDFDAYDRHEIKLLQPVNFGRVDGLNGPCNSTSQPSGWKCRDGRILFASTKGLVTVDPDIPPNPTPPPLVIERIIVDRKPVDLVAPSPNGPGALGNAGAGQPIRIPPGSSAIAIQYTGLSLQLAEKDHFKFQLQGVDTDWIDAGRRREAYYNNLAPGNYTFRVMACNNDNVWNEAPASLGIVLLPHFWQTNWFRTMAIVALLGGIIGTVRYVSFRKLQKKLAVLERQHAIDKERARIARDIHDDLGSRLTQIALLSDRCVEEPADEVRGSARKISHTARNLAQSLDEIVWAINPRHDTLVGLVEYISQFSDDFLEDTSIRSHLKLPDKLPPWLIPADTRHQFFLAFKEALHNAVKHSDAGEIEIEVEAQNNQIQISVVDNGAGFDPSAPGLRGNGLKNMRQRLERVGGKFEISSRPGKGTRVTLTIRLQAAPSPTIVG